MMLMKTIAIIAQKGGAGKTTLTLNLAITSKIYRMKTAILDTDPQESCTNWLYLRGQDQPFVKAANVENMEAMQAVLTRHKVDYCFIDTLPASNEIPFKAAELADLILIPVTPDKHHLPTVSATLQHLDAIKKLKIFVLLKFEAPKTKKEAKSLTTSEATVVTTLLKHKYPEIPIAPVILFERSTYKNSTNRNKGVLEFSPNSAAAEELKKLYSFINKKLKEKRAS